VYPCLESHCNRKCNGWWRGIVLGGNLRTKSYAASNRRASQQINEAQGCKPPILNQIGVRTLHKRSILPWTAKDWQCTIALSACSTVSKLNCALCFRTLRQD
jgi:hypothetical protein